MKPLLLIIWMFISLLLVCSVVGLLLFIPKDTYLSQDSNPSTWAMIGRKLLNSIIEQK